MTKESTDPDDDLCCRMYDKAKASGPLELKKSFLEAILRKSPAILTTKSFLALSTESLCGILKEDGLRVENELQIFKLVMRIGQHKCTSLEKKPSAQNLREVLKELIPLIRFPLLDEKDYHDYVKPCNILTDEQANFLTKWWDCRKSGNSPDGSMFSTKQRQYIELDEGNICKTTSQFAQVTKTLEDFSATGLYSGNLNVVQLEYILSHIQKYALVLSQELKSTQADVGKNKSYMEFLVQQTKDEFEKSQKKTNGNIEKINSNLQDTKTELKETQIKLDSTKLNLQAEHKETKKDLEATQSELQKTKAELQSTKKSLEKTSADLQKIKTKLTDTTTDLQETKELLEKTRADFLKTSEELKKTVTNLQSTKTNLKNTCIELEDTKTILMDTKKENQKLQIKQESRHSQLEDKLKKAETKIHELRSNLEDQDTKTESKIKKLTEKTTESKEKLQKLKLKVKCMGENSNVDVEAILSVVIPVGFIYVQFAKQPDPIDIWPLLEWLDVTDDYAGVFFRALGGNSAPFDAIQRQDVPRLALITTKTIRAYQEKVVSTVLPETAGSTECHIFTGADTKCGACTGAAWGMQFHVLGSEVRPRNMAIRIWKRIVTD